MSQKCVFFSIEYPATFASTNIFSHQNFSNMKKIFSIPGLMMPFVAFLLSCLSDVPLLGQSHFVKHYNNPVAESDAYVRFSNNFAVNGSSDNSFRILSAGLKTRPSSGTPVLELCFLKDDGTGRPTNPMREIVLDSKVGNNPKVLEIISNSQGHYIFIRGGNDQEALTYIHLNASGNLITTRILSWSSSNNQAGTVQINQVIPITNNSVALVGSLKSGGKSRVYFATVNLTNHVVTSQRQYEIDIDLDNQADNLTGLTIFRYGTLGYFIAGFSGSEYNERPFLMRVNSTGDFTWFRNWQDIEGFILGLGWSDDSKALPNMRLFAGSDGSGSTYYGLMYGGETGELRLIRYNPNVISGSGIIDIHMISGLPAGLHGESYMTDIDQVLTYPTIAVTFVHKLNSNKDFGSGFMAYNLLTHTAFYYNVFDGTAPGGGMRHAFTRKVVDNLPGLQGNKVPLYVGSESRDVSSTQFMHHLYVRTQPIGSNPLENFECHAGTQLTIDALDPVNFNLGNYQGQSPYILLFSSVSLSPTANIGFLAAEYCPGSGFQSPNNMETERTAPGEEAQQDILNEVERVRIYSFSGQLLYEASNLTIQECKDILIGQPGGFYLMERVMRNGERTTEKIFHGQR